MNLDLSEDQRLMRESFARFLDQHSSAERVRAAAKTEGHDTVLWRGLAELGAFSLRIPEAHGGLNLGLMDASVLMEEVGRTLASGPLAETLVATRALALLAGDRHAALLASVVNGECILTIAHQDISSLPIQWIAGGAVASTILARHGEDIVLVNIDPPGSEANLASTPLAELNLNDGNMVSIGTGASAISIFLQALEEWKLLVAMALNGLAREAIRLAADYACERVAFGQPIGTYQGISHPLADLITDVDGGKYFIWKTIHDLGHRVSEAGADISLALWWNAHTATRAASQALHTFGGYGLSIEYDIHLYNLRAKDWSLGLGDPEWLLEEAGRRLYAHESTELPDAGDVPIDFDLGDDAREMAIELREFFDNTLTPELRAKAHYSFDGFDGGVHKKLAEAKLLFPAWPHAYGGRAAAPYTVSALRKVWEAYNWTTHATSTTMMVGTMIQKFGSDELKREVLDRIVSGDVICSLGYSEPSCGSDVFAAQTKAIREGDDWRISGSKMWTSGANIAQYVLMLTRTDPALAKHKGLTLFVVPLDAEGVQVQPIHTFQDERTNVTYYDSVKIKDSYRLGEVNGGLKTMSAALELEHGGGFARSQNAMVKAAEKFCRDIRRGSRPLIEYPDAQKRLARSRLHVYLSELLENRALWSAVQKQPNCGYGPMAKLFSSEKFLTDARDLLDLTAPHSLSKRAGPAAALNLCYRHAQATTIYGGTSEVHRSQIAERNLGLPRTRG